MKRLKPVTVVSYTVSSQRVGQLRGLVLFIILNHPVVIGPILRT